MTDTHNWSPNPIIFCCAVLFKQVAVIEVQRTLFPFENFFFLSFYTLKILSNRQVYVFRQTELSEKIVMQQLGWEKWDVSLCLILSNRKTRKKLKLFSKYESYLSNITLLKWLLFQFINPIASAQWGRVKKMIS